MNMTHQQHTIEPLFDTESRILILGSFPSVKSREIRFFYGHPQNRFWKVVAGVLEQKVPETIEDKKNMLHQQHIALWDVIGACDIEGSSDSSIRNVIPNDLDRILKQAGIRKIYLNGSTAGKLYRKYLKDRITVPEILLPSTSPANAGYSLERLCTSWNIIREELR